jgi:hypothetical protein
MTSLIANIEFNNKYAKKVALLYLFYRLRMYAMSRGGSIVGFKFTKSEKYVTFSSLKELGWVNNDKVNSYRGILKNNVTLSISTQITKEDLVSLDKFKGFLIASAEAYILHRNNKIQNKRAFKSIGGDFIERNWNYGEASSNVKFWLKSKKISFNDAPAIIGRVYVSILETMMGISSRTITRWRKHSVNKYTTKIYTPSTVPFTGRTPDMFFKSKSGGLITIDQTIISPLYVFNSTGGASPSITRQK